MYGKKEGGLGHCKRLLMRESTKDKKGNGGECRLAKGLAPQEGTVSPEHVRCYINPDWQEMGHARVAVTRQIGAQGSGAIFLVDLYCLGVKDVMGRLRSIKEFEMFVPAVYFDGDPEIISSDLAREIVWGGVRYARSLGFEPHPEFEDEKYLLGEEVMPKGTITFGGPHGKPLYVVGPNDMVEEIVQTLEARVGKDGFEVEYPDEFEAYEPLE